MHKLSFVCFVFLLLGFTVYCLSSNACARRTSITPKRNGSTRADVSWATDTHTRHLFIDDLHRLKACSRQANYVSHHIVIILLAHETRRLYCRISELILINSSEIITLSLLLFGGLKLAHCSYHLQRRRFLLLLFCNLSTNFCFFPMSQMKQS